MLNTVLGNIAVEQLGNVLMHEHIFCSRFEKDYGVLDRKAIVKRGKMLLEDAKKAGIDTLLDATPPQLKRDVSLMQKVSHNSGVHIIACTGTYYFYDPQLDVMDADRIAGRMIDAYDRGIDNGGVRPGAIKCAVQDEITPYHKKLLLATAKAHRETGLPVTTHCSHATALQLQRILLDAGVKPGKLVIGHAGDYYDLPLQLELLKNKSFIGIDRMHDLQTAANVISDLSSMGFAEYMVLSHDRGVFMDFREPLLAPQELWQRLCADDQAQNRYEFSVIHNELIPMLQARNITADQLDCMLRKNPARFFG